jgi:hypothetical protein
LAPDHAGTGWEGYSFSGFWETLMPRGPKGEKRPADVIGNAVHVMRIATGEIEEARGMVPKRAKGGQKGGKARAENLSPEQRSQIAHAAAAARWKKGR